MFSLLTTFRRFDEFYTTIIYNDICVTVERNYESKQYEIIFIEDNIKEAFKLLCMDELRTNSWFSAPIIVITIFIFISVNSNVIKFLTTTIWSTPTHNKYKYIGPWRTIPTFIVHTASQLCHMERHLLYWGKHLLIPIYEILFINCI